MYINITIETPMYRERANRSLLTNHWSTIHQLMIDHSLINYWLITDWPIIDLSLVEELHLSFFSLEKYSIKLDYISLIEITYFYIYIYIAFSMILSTVKSRIHIELSKHKIYRKYPPENQWANFWFASLR